MTVTEPNNIHQRLGILVDYFCKGNKTAFGRETDILPGVLASIIGGRLSKPSFELLQKIVTRYPEINGDWLLLGRGPMLKLTSDRQPALLTNAEFVAKYEYHKANRSDLESILSSKYDLQQQILLLAEDVSQSKEQQRLRELMEEYKILIFSREMEIKGVAYMASPVETFVTRKQYDEYRQRVDNIERMMNALLDTSPPEVAARMRLAANQSGDATVQNN